MMKLVVKIFPLIGMLLCLVCCSDEDEPVLVEQLETGLSEHTLFHDNLEREYLLYLPESYPSSEPLPLVVSLHGAGGSKESQYALSQFNLLAETENFILVTPEATAMMGGVLTFWNQQSNPEGADDVGFIRALIDELVELYRIDHERVYVAGSSNGGFMALQLACQLGDKIAAVAAVKGYMTPDQISACDLAMPKAIIQMHGTEDPLVPYAGVHPTLEFWVAVNQTATSALESTLPDPDPNNGNTVNRHLFSNGQNGLEIAHLEVIGGIHDWFGEPGTNYDISASEEAWKFFEKFDINGLR